MCVLFDCVVVVLAVLLLLLLLFLLCWVGLFSCACVGLMCRKTLWPGGVNGAWWVQRKRK